MNIYNLALAFSAFLFAYANGDSLILNNQQSARHMDNCTTSQTIITLNLGYLKTEAGGTGYSIDLPDELGLGKGFISGPSQTKIPVYTMLLAIPPDAPLSFEIRNDKSTTLNDFSIAQVDKEDAEWINHSIAANGPWPEEIVQIEPAGTMRDIHLARLTIYPVQYDMQQKQLIVHYNLTLIINHPGSSTNSANEAISEAFAPIYRGFVANSTILSNMPERRGEYWFIVLNNFSQNISSLVDWKKSMGYVTRVFSLSNIGTNPNAIQIYNFILQHFNSASVKPDYICLIGDVDIPGADYFPSYTYTNPFGFGTIDSDNYYTFLLGQDYFPDVFIGRVSVANTIELNNYLSKYSSYTQNPYMTDTTWYHQATVVSGSDNSTLLNSPRATKMWCREMMLDHGFTNVDTFFATPEYSPPLSAITASLSRGELFVNYRGYGRVESWGPPDYGITQLAGITNGPKYGIMHSVVCATGDFISPGEVCVGEAWIRLSNRGGTGFIGNSNHDAHTKWTNSLDCGIYWGLFMTGARTLAQSELAGKMNLYLAFPEETYAGGEVELYFNSYNDLGDPGQNCWIAVPKLFSVSFPDTIGTGQTGIDVVITDHLAIPVNNAYVCLWKNQEVYDGQFTGEDGHARFQVACPDTGMIMLTVTSPDYHPYQGNIIVAAASATLGLVRYFVDDDSVDGSRGDGDHIANPCETIELSPTLQNFGSSQTAFGVSGIVSAVDSSVTITNDSSNYGDISHGDTARAITPYIIHIAPFAENNDTIKINLSLNSSMGPCPNNYILIPIKAASINVGQTSIQGDNNDNHLIEPGESGQLIVRLDNLGDRKMVAATAIIQCNDPLVQLIDQTAYYGNIDTNNNVSNDADPFVIHLSPETYVGRLLNFSIVLTGAGGVRQTCKFTLTAGAVTSDDPIGPDEYGYYCFDNTDTAYSEHPVYSWIATDTNWSHVTLNDDDVATINLPFLTKFYGSNYNQVTICDNGYIAFGQTWWANFQNAQIPGPQCAKAMVAPLWDDLRDFPTLNIYYKHFPATGQFVIGWNAHERDQDQIVTFEIIILDTAILPTRTGDNDIIFQYASDVSSLISNSIGICNFERTIGIQYQFNQNYSPGAAPLANQRAIKFTTGIPSLCSYVQGDINGDGQTRGSDVTFGVRYFKGLGAPPPDSCSNDSIITPSHYLFVAGDVNGDCQFRGSDITRLVSYFKGLSNVNSCRFFPPSRRRLMGLPQSSGR